MATIVQEGHPVLREIAQPVPDSLFGTEELSRILADMVAALDEQPDGVALAAPQIGISLRIFIVRNDRLVAHPEGMTPEADIGIYINPSFTRTSRRRSILEEGCLSVRGTYGKTQRFDRASVRAQEPDGRTFERGGGGLLAQIFQHEIDHLNGVLFVDHAEDMVEVKLKSEANEVAREADIVA